MTTALPGALMRAVCVMTVIALPSLLLPMTGVAGLQVLALVSLFAATFIVIEYTVASPSFVEFRSAPPFNRLRFIALTAIVLILSLILRGIEAPSTLTRLMHLLAERIGYALDFPFSPVRLMLLMMPAGTDPAVLDVLRMATGLSYVVALGSTLIFAAMLGAHHWPARNGAFNVWVNLPMFDPTAGGDIVARLQRDGQVNLILGFLLPFVFPAAGKVASLFMAPFAMTEPHSLIWIVSAWAILPASLMMRGIALHRVAGMIHSQRRRNYAQAAANGMLPT
ncbi:hypothetical protein SAMN04488003_11018 [Loktanella fryxellensis]|uniref:Uncharacterized protein n=2 Tax=Loktanella fryxellensis TaxID=245187 RepID=A0A1H8E901_9RHOB|nr:hypothetical protein SAMN04488003_11018 [Loktanella fryxellensis]